MTPSPNAFAIIRHYEQLRLRAYLPTPDDVPTIGWGHTKGVKMGDTCTEEQADQWLEEDVQEAVAFLNRELEGVPTTQNQFDALVSWAFNVGSRQASTSTLLRHHKEGYYLAAQAQFHLWIYQNKKRLTGLIRRRSTEADLYGYPEQGTIWVLKERAPR